MEARKWKKGQSPNPSGRPKGSVSLLTRINRKLRQKITEGPHAGRRYADLVADSVVKGMIKGKWPQTKDIIDREDGPPGEPPLTIKHEHSHEHKHTIDYDQL